MIDKIAKTICRERCAFFGERPCFMVHDDAGLAMRWPNPNCDEPGCHALAAAICMIHQMPVLKKPK
jgi:hypothetical protein